MTPLYHLEQALVAQPELVDAAYELGRMHYARGRYEAAAAAFEQALGQGPGKAEIYIYLGNTCAQLGREEEARRWFGELLSRFPDHPQAKEIKKALSAGL